MYNSTMKVISLIFLLVFCVVSLAGCGQSSGTARDTDMEEELDKLEKLNETTLKFWVPFGKNRDTQLVLDEIASKTNLNIKLDFQFLGIKYEEKIKTKLASNEPVDAFYVGRRDFFTEYDYVDMARKGELKDITALLPEYAPNIYKRLSEVELSAIKVNGKIFTVPSLYPQASFQYVEVDYDLMQKYNIPPIKTFEDYGAYLKTVEENEKDIIPGDYIGVDTQFFARAYDYVVLDNAASLVYKQNDPKMKIIPWEQTPEFRHIVNLISTWNEKGYLRKVSEMPEKKISAGIILNTMVMEGSSKTRDNNNAFTFLLYPTKPIYRLNPIGNYMQNGAIGFNPKSNNVERALMFLDWIQSSQENYDLFMYGIKGKHYDLVGDRISTLKDPKYNVYTYSNEAYYPFRNIEFRRLGINSISPDNFNETYIDFINSKTEFAPHEGFMPDYSKVMLEYSIRVSLIKNIIENLRRGEFRAEDIDIAIQRLKDAGVEKVMYEIQKQLDDWIATNK